MCEMEPIPHWKRIWMTLSGTRSHINSDVAAAGLDFVLPKLAQGLAMYKPYSEESYTLLLQTLGIDNEEFRTFVKTMCFSLNLDCCLCWSMVCNYLKFHNYVDTSNLNNITNYLLGTPKFVNDIWLFYKLERMFLLKTINCIVENCNNLDHSCNSIYRDFVNKITYKTMLDNLFDQFCSLTREITYENRTCCVDIMSWVERNGSEQVQILLTILTILSREKCDVNTFLVFLKEFKEYNSTFILYYVVIAPSEKVANAIRNLKIAIFLACLSNFWEDHETWYFKFQEINYYVKELYKNWKSPIVLIACVALQLTLPFEETNSEFSECLQSYLGTAIDQKVLLELDDLISNNIFQNSFAGFTIKLVSFTILEVLCVKLGADKIYDHEGSVKLLASLLLVPDIALKWNGLSEDGIKKLYSHAVCLFPAHFFPLSVFVKSLIRLKHDNKSIVEGLCNLQVFAERYFGWRNLVTIEEEIYELDRVYKPFPNDFIVFESGTSMTIEKRTNEEILKLHTSYSYFKVLLAVVDILYKLMDLRHSSLGTVEASARYGYEVILEILKVDPQLIENIEDAQELIRLVPCVLFTYMGSRMNYFHLVDLCFEILVTLFDTKPGDVVKNLSALRFLPVVTKDCYSIEKFIELNCLSEAKITNYISDLFSSASCNLICLYISLVKKALKGRLFIKEIVFPGLIFLVGRLFPVFAKEFSSNNNIILNVCCELISLINCVLIQQRRIENEMETLCIDSVLNLFFSKRLYTSSLITICSITNTKMEIMLSSETNYVNGPILSCVKCLEDALNILNTTLHYSIVFDNKDAKDMFENHLWRISFDGGIYSSDESVLNIILGYICHSFNQYIPKLAFKILRNFALASEKPILSTLKIESVGVRCLALEYLNDVLLDEATKVAILYFIKDCVHKQSGMTAAFFDFCPDFNVKISGKQENVSDYITDYLAASETDDSSSSFHLKSAIFKLLHVLWEENKQPLILKINSMPDFWPFLCSQLCKTEGILLESCILTFEILVLELCLSKGKVSTEFSNTIENMLHASSNFVSIWVDRLISLTQISNLNEPENENISESIASLAVFKKFILSIYHFYPAYKSQWSMPDIEMKCFETLLYCMGHLQRNRLLELWTEYCLIFFVPNNKTETEVKKRFKCMTSILSTFVDLYSDCSQLCSNAVLTLALRVLEDTIELISNNANFYHSFLETFTQILQLEYNNIMKNELQKHTSVNFYHNWILLLKVFNTFLKMDIIVNLENFYVKSLYLERVCEVLKHFVIERCPVRIIEVTILSLICYAESKLDFHFDFYYTSLISTISFPNYVLDINMLKMGVVPEYITDFWTIYTHLILLNGILLQKRGGLIAEQLLIFVDAHQMHLCNTIASVTSVANAVNLSMVSHILQFLYGLLKYFMLRKKENRKPFDRIITSINEVLNVVAHILLNPNMLMCIFDSNPTQIVPYWKISKTGLIHILNRYVEIITWSCMCLNRITPLFINMLGAHKPDKWSNYVEYDFRVPPPLDFQQSKLTYNSLLCILHFICNTLTQIYVVKERGDVPVIENPLAERLMQKINVSTINVVVSRLNTSEVVNSMNTLFADSPGLQNPWLLHLDEEMLHQSLLALTTLLAGQVFITIQDFTITSNAMRYIIRELCSELLHFYDFVHSHIIHKSSTKVPPTSNTADTRIIATPRKHRFQKPSPKSRSQLCLYIDVTQVCCDRRGKNVPIFCMDDSYLIVLTHWFRHVCRLVHYSKFDDY
ncbi:hypothetical protein FQA39_LY04622 [Lamprigera yunnana]|nr:hypothetical protein FQA39_LY04622 [Lamprigera yunnana]